MSTAFPFPIPTFVIFNGNCTPKSKQRSFQGSPFFCQSDIFGELYLPNIPPDKSLFNHLEKVAVLLLRCNSNPVKSLWTKIATCTPVTLTRRQGCFSIAHSDLLSIGFWATFFIQLDKIVVVGDILGSIGNQALFRCSLFHSNCVLKPKFWIIIKNASPSSKFFQRSDIDLPNIWVSRNDVHETSVQSPEQVI